MLLKVSFTSFLGNIPSSFGNLDSLEELDVAQCNFSGGLVPSSLGNLRKLTYLDISANRFGGPIPDSLANLTQLATFRISTIPASFSNLTNLQILYLHSNTLTGAVEFQMFQNLQSLYQLELSSSGLELVTESRILNSTVKQFTVLGLNNCNIAADNNFTGEISPLLCNMKNLQSLDLSKNNLGGMLPQCLGNFRDHLILLLLGNNSFHGIIPQTYNKGSSLRMIDVSHNKLQGQLPRSLANCVMLEHLVLSNNRFNDVFPIWLGTLLELKLLAMRHNGFYGMIGRSRKNVDFPKLRILDLAYNDFTGAVPSMFPDITVNKSTYMNTGIAYDVDGFPILSSVAYQLMMGTKGLEQYYPKIQEEFASFDISSNKFEGKIPEFIGDIKDLRSLNLSHNILTGSIPSSLGNLMKLESLDLSQNKVSGRAIPQRTQLTSLNVTSYDGNPWLCGDPLPKKCGNPKAPELPPSTVDEGDSSSEGIFEFDWKIVSAGCGSGLVVGVVLADVVITRRPDLFLKIVGMIRQMIRKI
ncbi:receptor-like protein 43 [Malus domestica]|uniref:receptor-like protein 43 n=1 Tax=Malus domestica TaxID=3750 RepID=UPI003976D1F2